jgi:hypothetical protein
LPKDDPHAHLLEGQEEFWRVLNAMADFRQNAYFIAQRWNSYEELLEYVKTLENTIKETSELMNTLTGTKPE